MIEGHDCAPLKAFRILIVVFDEGECKSILVAKEIKLFLSFSVLVSRFAPTTGAKPKTCIIIIMLWPYFHKACWPHVHKKTL